MDLKVQVISDNGQVEHPDAVPLTETRKNVSDRLPIAEERLRPRGLSRAQDKVKRVARVDGARASSTRAGAE